MRLRHRRFEDEPTLGARIEAGFQYGFRLTLRLRPLDTLPQNPVAAEMRLAAHSVMNQEEGRPAVRDEGHLKNLRRKFRNRDEAVLHPNRRIAKRTKRMTINSLNSQEKGAMSELSCGDCRKECLQLFTPWVVERSLSVPIGTYEVS